MTDRTGSSVTRTEFSWSTRIRSLLGGDATGLSSCTDRRRGGLSWPKWPANTPYNTQGGNEWTCSRCMMSRPLWRGGIPTKRQAPAAFPFSVWQAGGESSARILLTLLNTTRVMGRSAVAMRGGRVQELYKNKGDRNETESHRGILVQDLPGAMHASFLKRDIDEHT